MTVFDAATLRELEALRRRLQVRARSAGSGDRIASRRGSSAEFLEHRAYEPGDDLRRIDWLAYARSGDPVFKLFRAEEDVVVRIILDASGSLSEEPKRTYAKKLAASVGYMALANQERVQFASSSVDGVRISDPMRGRAALPKLLRLLDECAFGGPISLADAMATVVSRSSRAGLLVIVSDFFDASPVEEACARARTEGHDLALLQVLSPEELSPPYDGDFALEDVETGALTEVTFDSSVIDAYLLRLNQLFVRLRSLAKRNGASYVRTSTSSPTLEAIRRIVAKGVD